MPKKKTHVSDDDQGVLALLSGTLRDEGYQVFLTENGSFGIDKCSKRGFITNNSTTGAAIQTNRVFSPGADLSLLIELKRKVIDVCGNVRWARKTIWRGCILPFWKTAERDAPGTGLAYNGIAILLITNRKERTVA